MGYFQLKNKCQVLGRFVFILSLAAGGFARGEDLVANEEKNFVVFESARPNSTYEGPQMQILGSGIASLKKRIDMIRSAQKSIELEYFIFSPEHTSTRLLLRELLLKAAQGVKVRISIDKSLATFELDNYYSEIFKKHGIEFRYYNNAGILPSSSQFRNHRKMISVDGYQAITGGRNIADEYFDLSPEYNFHDLDVYVEGKEVVSEMVASFDAYWNHKIMHQPKDPVRPQLTSGPPQRGSHQQDKNNQIEVLHYEKKQAEMKKYVQEIMESSELSELSIKVDQLGQQILSESAVRTCPKLTYTTDLPGGNFRTRIQSDYKSKYRFVKNAIREKILQESGPSIYVTTPYFMHNKKTSTFIDGLIAKGKKVTVATNSLASTDAVYAAAIFYMNAIDWALKGVNVYMHNSQWNQETPLTNEAVTKARWGTHSKAIVYHDQGFLVGTYNIDNRSAFYNSEMVIFCDGSPELTQDVMQVLNFRQDSSYKIIGWDPNVLKGSFQQRAQVIDKDGKRADIYGGATNKQIRLMKALAIPSRLLQFLL